MWRIRFTFETYFWLGLIILAWLIFFATRAHGQGTISVACPAMPTLKIRPGLWQAQVEVSVAVVKLSSGETLTFQQFTIQKTLVRGLVRRSVDPCVITGVSADGSVMTLQLPREHVVMRGFTPTALAMTARGTLTRPNGDVLQVILNYPACATHRAGRGVRIASAIVATGTVTP